MTSSTTLSDGLSDGPSDGLSNGLSNGPSNELAGRLANVSAALIADTGVDEGRTQEFSQALGSLFEDVVVVAGAAADEPPGEAALGELVRALSAAREDRVLVVAADAPRPTPTLWLALTAWPQHDVVTPHPSPTAPPPCVLYRRDAVLVEARERLRAAEAGEIRIVQTRAKALQGVTASLDADVIEGEDWVALQETET